MQHNPRNGYRLTAGLYFFWITVLSVVASSPVAVARTNEPLSIRQIVVEVEEGVEIRRTTDDIPHVSAQNWRNLGVGVGYVQAQDALCTLAEAFVTYAGRRAWFFGPETRPSSNSTFGRPKNLDLDFFFRTFIDKDLLARYRGEQPAELNELIEGFAMGYNRYLADARTGREQSAGRTCLAEPWVREITGNDIYRRMYAAQIAAGYARFITELTNTRPGTVPNRDVGGADALRMHLAQRIGEQPGLGSNVIAFGQLATRGDGAVLFGNPHWFWGGPDRFYQMHLTIPGRLNAAGVAFLGVPIIMIGFNEQVAWSHTVSAARRFGLFDLTLDPKDPTQYLIEGEVERMISHRIGIDVHGEDGKPRRLTRTFYRTRFGPVVDLASHDSRFGWGQGHAVSIRDINAENFRVFRTYFYWNQAKSLDDFIAIQRREASISWVNTVAIGRGDGRVWYGDIGAVPNVPDELRRGCTTPLAQGFARIDPLTPVLDGSRAGCDWRNEPNAVQRGAMPASKQPWLLREDYVANMNDSYWLTNVHQPLEGFPAVLGGERESLGLRGRLGHRMALDLLQVPSDSAAALSKRLMTDVLTPRAYSAELFKDELLVKACASSEVILGDAAEKVIETDGLAKVGQVQKVDVGRACRILRSWSNKADADDRGVLLWEVFWARLNKMTPGTLYHVAFSSNAPLTTPAKPSDDSGRAAQALALAVLTLAASGTEMDSPLRDRRLVEVGAQRLPIYGGCDSVGYFTVACNYSGRDQMGPEVVANSYLQMVSFGENGVEAHTLLAHGQDESTLLSGREISPVVRYAHKEWLRFPFQDNEINNDRGMERTVLTP